MLLPSAMSHEMVVIYKNSEHGVWLAGGPALLGAQAELRPIRTLRWCQWRARPQLVIRPRRRLGPRGLGSAGRAKMIGVGVHCHFLAAQRRHGPTVVGGFRWH
jgi:hypothetical protein